MNAAKWKLLRSEFIADLKIFKARFDYLLNPHNQKEVKVTVLDANDAANVVALNAKGEILMTRQFRFGTQEYSLEIPGGFIEENETPLLAVQREFQEETGYSSKNWKPLGSIFSNPVYQTAKIYHFVAFDVEKTHATNFDDAEQIETIFYSQKELKDAVKGNRITHPHTISALCRLFNLFDGKALI